MIAADVYTSPSHIGRGGWTWYTGSASWMYRVGLESILGFTRQGDTLRVTPCVPEAWPEFSITYRHQAATYRITVRQPALIRAHGASVWLDGSPLKTDVIPLVDDEREHIVIIEPRVVHDD